jgi:small subunit ribosomal protein S16
MAVRIRLKRMGRKKQPHYRVVVADGTSPRDGRFVESLGYYKPLSSPARLVLDLERVDYWIGEGAEPSNTVKSLISRARSGGDDTVAYGEPDLEARKQQAREELAARRAAEKKAEEDEAARVKAEADAAAQAKADAEAAEAAAAEEAESSETAEAEAEAPADEPVEPPADEEAEAPAAEAEPADEAEADEEAEPADEADEDEAKVE